MSEGACPYPLYVAAFKAGKDDDRPVGEMLYLSGFAEEQELTSFTPNFEDAIEFSNEHDARRAAGFAALQGLWVTIEESELDWDGNP